MFIRTPDPSDFLSIRQPSTRDIVSTNCPSSRYRLRSIDRRHSAGSGASSPELPRSVLPLQRTHHLGRLRRHLSEAVCITGSKLSDLKSGKVLFRPTTPEMLSKHCSNKIDQIDNLTQPNNHANRFAMTHTNKSTWNGHHKTKATVSVNYVLHNKVLPASMDKVRQQRSTVSALAAWNNPYRLQEDPIKLAGPQAHQDISINQQMIKQQRCASPESKCLISRSQIPPKITVSASPRRISSISEVAKGDPLTSDNYEIDSLTSPTDSSVFEVPTPPSSPTPSCEREQWAQKFTSRAGAVSREILAFALDEPWSPEYERSPAFNDRPIFCRLPATRKKIKTPHSDAFNELGRVFRDTNYTEGQSKSLPTASLLEQSFVDSPSILANHSSFMVMKPNVGGKALRGSFSAAHVDKQTHPSAPAKFTK